ncbi:MAG: cation transporter [Eubacterium sp.]|nr:cation transporter [Eubacterium sp.]
MCFFISPVSFAGYKTHFQEEFMTNREITKRLSAVGIGGNILLSAFKLIAGIFGRSGAMVSDAVHSLSDVFATIIAFLGVKLSEKQADESHPYGHERFECVASMVLGVILGVTGVGIGYTGVRNIFSGDFKNLQVPTVLPLVAAIVSIVAKEIMYRYTMHYAKMMNSAAFEADAWHHRSDAFSSIGSLIGIVGARLGLPVMDPIASVVIAAFILKVAYEIIRDALDQMMDSTAGADYEEKLTHFIEGSEGVEGIDLLHTRKFSSRIYVDVEIAVDRNSSLIAAHEIAERVHDGIEENFPEVKHVMVHVNPGKEKPAD